MTPRDPYAGSLGKDQYRQRVIPSAKHRKHKKRERANEAANDTE